MNEPTWSWADVARPFRNGAAQRASGGRLSRFRGTSHHADREQASLDTTHPAVTEGRTLFPSRVFAADAVPRVLVSGHNSAKIGAFITKRPWRGLPIFTLTLQERAACPRGCTLWRECYGNAMPLARRHAAGAPLVAAIARDLRLLLARHTGAIAVRLHVLGDFYDAGYVLAWARWMNLFPRLRVWGYTARPAASDIGDLLVQMNEHWPHRWLIRFSVAPDARAGIEQVTTIWRQTADAQVLEGLVCPTQQDRTATCGTCGLCWSPAMRQTRIVFIGHGMRKRARLGIGALSGDAPAL